VASPAFSLCLALFLGVRIPVLFAERTVRRFSSQLPTLQRTIELEWAAFPYVDLETMWYGVALKKLKMNAINPL
jgi:hypothetical protein